MTSVVLRAAWVDSEFQKRVGRRLPRAALLSPGPQWLHAVSFEHRWAFADLAWLDAVQAVGHGAVSDPTFWDRVVTASNFATDFDPKFYTVYDAAATVLSVWGQRVDESDALLEKGHRELPNEWRLPFMLGYNAFFIRGRANRAADWIEKASQLPGRPRYLPALAGRMRFFGGEPERATAFLERMIQDLSGPARQDAEWRLTALRSEYRMRRFDAACRAFLDHRGILPKSGSELVGEGYIREAPFDEFGKVIEFTTDCVAFTDEIGPEGRSTEKRKGQLRGSPQ